MNAIKALRESQGMSQSTLSRKSGVKQQTISMLETGERKMPRVDTAKKLADALGCTVDDLLKDSKAV